MNFPPAPLSISLRVLMFLFSLAFLIEMEIDKEFDLIVAIFTEKTSTTGESDVDAALHFKNPLSRLHHKIPLSLLHSLEQ